MQATLLGLAIAMILALVTALVGPHFVDWSRYRAEFEAQASRMTGLDVKVAGPIDVRLLPTPTLVLQQVEISRPGDASAMRAQKLGLELALNSLVRGEVRANDVLLEGPDVLISLDKDGRVDWPAPAVTFDADAVSIQQLDIVDGRAVLSDAASGSRLVLDKFEFKGEVRSLAGAIKGEGSFYVAGQHYPYRINASRMGEDKGLRVRLNVDPIDRPVAADVEATVWTEGRIPHFEGSLQLARPVGRAAAGAPDLITEPWRVTTKIKGDSAAAVLEQVEFQYGPDDRAIKLHGDARLNFGATPQIEGVLSSPQVDLDRVLALPEATRRRPLVATRTFADYLTSAHLPLPVKLGISVENLVLAGATLQRVSGDIRSDADSVDVQSLDFRAPGATQVRLSGRLNVTPHGVAFAGPAKVESRDTRALVAWLTDRSDAQGIAGGSLRAEGDVNFGSEAIAVERLKADVDRMAIEGRLAYAWPSGDRPARLEAALNAAEIDLDRAAALARGIFADTEFQWPGEGKLALKVDKASIAGVEAQRADVNLSFDQRGIDIQRLAIGDFGGTAISAKGGIDSRTLTPRGTITVDLDARGFDGLATVMEKFSPPAAEQIRRAAKKFVPAKLQLSLALDPNAARTAGTPVGAKLKVDGTAGAFQVSLQTDAGLVSDALAPGNLPKLATVETNLSGRLEAADATALVALIGLDGLLSVDKGRPGHISLTANGPLDGRLAVDGQIQAPGLDVGASGTLRLAGGQGATANLDLKVASANVRTSRQTLPTTLTARMALADNVATLSELVGKVAGTDFGGRLIIGLTQPAAIDGDIKLGSVDLPAAVANVIGAPAKTGNAAAVWPSDPFEPGLLATVQGRIKVSSARVALTPKLVAQDARGVLTIDSGTASFEALDGSIAGGRVQGALQFQRDGEELTSHASIHIAGADIAELAPGDGHSPLAGRLTLDAELDGAGRSPFAVIGSLKGSSTFTLQDGRIARLDPAAFDAVIRSVDLGLPIETVRIRDRIEISARQWRPDGSAGGRRNQHQQRSGARRQHDGACARGRSRRDGQHRPHRRRAGWQGHPDRADGGGCAGKRTAGDRIESQGPARWAATCARCHGAFKLACAARGRSAGQAS